MTSLRLIFLNLIFRMLDKVFQDTDWKEWLINIVIYQIAKRFDYIEPNLRFFREGDLTISYPVRPDTFTYNY